VGIRQDAGRLATSERLAASIVSMDTCHSTIIVLPFVIGERREKISVSPEGTVNEQGRQVKQRAVAATDSSYTWMYRPTVHGVLPLTPA
jgi:hypothetical protein